MLELEYSFSRIHYFQCIHSVTQYYNDANETNSEHISIWKYIKSTSYVRKLHARGPRHCLTSSRSFVVFLLICSTFSFALALARCCYLAFRDLSQLIINRFHTLAARISDLKWKQTFFLLHFKGNSFLFMFPLLKQGIMRGLSV